MFTGLVGTLCNDARLAAKVSLAALVLLLPFENATAASCPANNRVTIQHLTGSNCELCGVGEVRLRVNYNGQGNNPDLTNLIISEYLSNPGLRPIPGTTRITARYGSNPPSVEPTLVGDRWTWNLGNYNLTARNDQRLDITYQVRRLNNLTEEGLSSANKSINANVSYSTDTDACGTRNSGNYNLPFDRPQPQITKRGRNVDAGQSTWTQTVYGHNNDDVIWRIQIQNSGAADMQDLRFRDLMGTGNHEIRFACPTEAEALAIANNDGNPVANNCKRADQNVAPWITRPAANEIDPFVVTNPFGQRGSTNFGAVGSASNGFTRNLNNREVDVRAGQSTYIYLVGKVTANGSCSASAVNTASDLQFGCEADNNGAGGISAGGSSSARLYTRYGELASLSVERQLTGINTSQPVGTRGQMTITLRNESGGTVKFADSLAYHLRDELPPEYVIDPTFTPTVTVTSSGGYGNYPGRVDRITWINSASGTFPLTTTNPTAPLGNTEPEFKLSSSTSHPVYADQHDMMRHGDTLTIRFQVVLIKSDFYDRVANLDVTPEVYPGTDPDYQSPLSNTLHVRFDTFCATQGTQDFTLTGNGTGSGNHSGSAIRAHPEDLDIAIDGAAFILTNDPNQQLTLPVLVTNNGGHDARDFNVFATFGATMEVVSAPAGCGLASLSGTPPQPAPWKVWVNPPSNPIPLPDAAIVYQCTSPAVIRPGQTARYDFRVVKTTNPQRLLLDDLTFRADVVGEITLSDGTPLWFPAPIRRADDELDRANNYSLDAVWARVIGFNLMKSQVGACTENNPPVVDTIGGKPVERVEIGEECTYRIDTGGWFGFETPGFAYIAVQNIDVVDQVPDGQAYISSTDPYAQSTSRIAGVALNPASLAVVTEGWFDWRFNIPDSERIEEADEWFRVDVTTRVLNKALNERSAPNFHAQNSHNVINSTFDATFQNKNTGVTEKIALGPTTIGYPNEPLRRVDLTVTEPQILITHEVCNETRHGVGAACSDFRPVYEAVGDAYDNYIYRIVLENQASADGVARAPAYDVVATVDLDPSGLEYVLPFGSDGLDNDGDGIVDDGSEGQVENNDSPSDKRRARIIYSWEHSDPLLKIEPGEEVTLYYRVDPHDEVSPQQWLRHNVSVSYDSLAGEHGAQTVVTPGTGELGGSRAYEDSGDVRAQMIAVEVSPKIIERLSNTPKGTAQPQVVSIGEELEYKLIAHLPVAGLWNFVIRDELVDGLSCIEAPTVDLSEAPYDVAGFRRPNGSPIPPITPVCEADSVVWDFGDVKLTNKPAGASRFEFPVSFIARVNNVSGNNNGTILKNGGTTTTLSYVDDQGNPVRLEYGEVEAVVTEPEVDLTKSFAPIANADAADELTITVTAENTGTAAAYNLRILDDLTDRNLSFIQGSVSGNDPPDSVDITTFGANQPVFIWEPSRPLAPGTTLSFAFSVRVHDDVQPLQVLENTIQANWTSLPDDQTALNSAGSIGVDGSAEGMRIGVLPNADDSLNDYESVASAAVTVPPLALTKTDVSLDVVPTIGAHKRFTIEIVLPEGVSRNVRVRDALDAGAESYLLARDAHFDIEYTFEGIASINGAPPAEHAFLAAPQHGTTGVVEWNIGEVVTLTENDTAANVINPRVLITYYARIDNVDAIRAGTTLHNRVELRYANGEDPTVEEVLNDVSGTITVVEPALTTNKTVQNLTRGTGTAQGGDILQYQVSVENSGGATAYDVNLADTLPVDVLLYTGFTPTASVNGTAVAGFEPVPTQDAAGATVWGRGNGDNSLSIPPGGRLELTYQVVVERALTDLVNQVWVDWTSLVEHPTVYERTGAGCPSWTAPDKYCVGPATTTTTTTDTTTLEKSVVADSFDTDGSTAIDAVLRVGDSVVYRLVLYLPEGRLHAVRIEDVLDPGLAFEGIVSVNGVTAAPFGQSLPFTHAPVQVPTQTGDPASGLRLDWALGDIYNAPDQEPANDAFVIEYRARVVEGVLPHQPSVRLDNRATLKYLDGNGGEVIDPARLQDSAQIEVRQPLLANTVQSDRGAGRVGAGTESDPYRVTLATDTMEFRLESCNASGLAPAYGVVLSDTLAPEFDEQSLGVPTLSIAGAVLVEDTDYSYTPPAGRGGTMRFELERPIPPSECLTVDYNVGFHTDLAGNRLWSNSAVVEEYWSRAQVPAEQYAPLGTAAVWMTNDVSIPAPIKQLFAPASGEATIGEEVHYTITVPGAPVNAELHDVVVSDRLDPHLEFVSASAVDGTGNPVTLNATESGQDLSFDIGRLAAGEQVVMTLVTRVANSAQTVDAAGSIVTNHATYTFANAGQSWTSAPADGVSIVEPTVTISKTPPSVAAPTAGDILSYTVELNAAAGAAASDAFDLMLSDELGPALEYVPGSALVDGVPVEPVVDGARLTWPAINTLAAGAAPLVVSYDLRVLDSVTPGDTLDNTATVRWTSLPGERSPYERTGELDVPHNDYVATDSASRVVQDLTTLAKARLSDTFGAADTDVRIGDTVEYELRLGLQEGTHRDLVLTDTLPVGLAFEGVVSADYFGTPGTAVASVSGQNIVWDLGQVVNPADGDATNDYLTIVYRARVLNGDVLAQHPTTQSLTNSATLAYRVAGQPAPPLTASESIRVLQPELLLGKSAAPEGGDAIVEAGERILYTLTLHNVGAGPAYDALIEDILPPGLDAATLNTVAIELVNAGTALPILAPNYDPTSRTARWDLDTATANAYTVPSGETLRLTYEVRTEAGLGAGVTLTNTAQVARYYSFDGAAVPPHSMPDGRQVYGPSDPATATLSSAAPGALLKAITQQTAAVGERFSYRINMPATPIATALYDVRIVDDLSASSADLRFVSVSKVSGSGSWTPVNTGTDTQLVIEDTETGIDIPAGEQAVVEITVELLDTSTNVSDLLFTNTADYTYNRANGDEATRVTGQSDTSPEMRIVGPDALTLRKSGPASMQLGQPASFTLDIQNTGTGRAWDITVVDQLPDPAPGGMCDAAPTAITAQVFEADGVTAVSPVLTAGIDYSSRFVPSSTTAAGDPACELIITGLTAAAAPEPQQRLIIGYQAQLDADNVDGTTLTNIAGVTEWFSADTDGSGTSAARVYTRVLSDGTVGVLDHEDAFTVTTESPVLVVQKTVTNVASGQNPGSNAQPGDTLRYTITITNIGSVATQLFSLRDELDRLNVSPVFAGGSLNLVNVPAGADTSGTNPNGGAAGTGYVEISDLQLDAQGGANDRLVIEFEATLVPVITHGTVVRNQGELLAGGYVVALTDDPNINGAADPTVPADADPTETLIASAPLLEVWKTSTVLSDDPAALRAGDTLRYTITVQNLGSEDAVDLVLRDPLPANTHYVPNSTTLNGVPVTEPTPGLSPLEDGIAIHAPGDPTPGTLRADSDQGSANRATITFDVVVDPDVLNGTVISNQGVVSGAGAGSGPFPPKLSDDPVTPVLDDPTRDVVGHAPLLDAHKTVAIQVDNGSQGIVDPGDVLRYSIVVRNAGAVPATNVVFIDAVPTNTTYVADSLRLNGLALGQPDGGVSPLIAGIPISSSDLTPPLPGVGEGTIAPGGAALITFDVQVNAGVPEGTVISNQGLVRSTEQLDEPTDADGNPANGHQPTRIVVGPAQQLALTKEVFVVGGGPALPGATLEYVVRATNIGSLPAIDVRITDDLDAPVPGQLAYVAGTGTLDGSAAGVSFAAPVLTADYSTQYGALAPGASTVLRFRAQIAPALAIGETVTNTAEVTWNAPVQRTSASVSIDIGGMPGSAILNGRAWHDANFNNTADSGERPLAGWSVDVYRGSQLLGSVTTDSTGAYRIPGLAPNTAANPYELRFRAPGASAGSAMLGHAHSVFTNGLQRISGITADSGSNLQDLNLPITPNGVVYDSVTRTPVAGAAVSLVRGGIELPGGCFDDPGQQGQITNGDGYYKFDINFTDPACAAGGSYMLRVTPPATGFTSWPSRIIPPASDESTAAFHVPSCPGGPEDALPATPDHCEVQPSAFAPASSIAARTPGTAYHLHLTLNDNRVPGDSQIFNNHLPLDPELDTAIAISKTASRVNVSRGEHVPYTITLRNTLGTALADLSVVDDFPAGFKYVEGSSRLNGLPVEPDINGRQLLWDNLDLAAEAQHTIQLLFIVGAGVSEGEYVNRARVLNNRTGEGASGEASATVRVVPDPTFDCTDITGKVFDDRNLDGAQDPGEAGLAGVRLVTARGLIAETDAHGRFHITCAVVPNEDRGSNFILKLDERSLPTGYRVTTENPRVQRATRGKMLRFNFGATLHRVVRLDVADGVFEPGSTQMRVQWTPRLTVLLDELRKSPSIVRIAYLADVEEQALVTRRLKALERTLHEGWQARDWPYALAVETEVFWRRGGPPER